MASEGLIAMTCDGTIFLGNGRYELAHKTAIPLLESKSARLRINGLLLLVNLLGDKFSLGSITRKSLKSRTEELLRSTCSEERDAACQLLAVLLCFQQNGDVQSSDKVVESWIRLADRHPFEDEWTAKIFVRCLRYIKDADKFILEVIKERQLSLAIVPDSKKKVWHISVDHLSDILSQARLILTGPTLQSIVKSLLKSKDECVRRAVFPWYLGLISEGFLPVTEAELLRIPLLHEDFGNITAATIAHVVNDGCTKFKLILSLFAQIKGDWTLLSSGDSSVSARSIYSCALSLSALLSPRPNNNYDRLYRSAELFEQVKDWSILAVTEAKNADIISAGFFILGSLVSYPHLINIDECLSLIMRIFPSRAGIESITKLELPVGAFKFLCCVIATDADTKIMEMITKYVLEQWNASARVSDLSNGINIDGLEMLCKVTISMPSHNNFLGEAASMVCSRAICSIPKNRKSSELLQYCAQILKKYFKGNSIAGQKYHLAQFNIFVKSAPFRESIFNAVAGILDDINLTGRTSQDQILILDTLKQIIFPFVCDPDLKLQRLATECLGNLVRIVNTRDFRDAMLQELIDRSLNEHREEYRRGYIIGIGEVYAAIPENGSQLDLSAVLGLLSSLAKDQRSLIVQSAAIDSLRRVVDARSNSVAAVLTFDIIFLTWQIYMTDSNAVPVDSAVEETLLDSITSALLVMIEMLGPELSESITVSRICKLMLGEFLEYDNRDPCLLNVLFKASTQVLLICQKAENLPALLSRIRISLDGMDPEYLPNTISCFKWLLEFHSAAVIPLITPSLVSSLFNLYPIESLDIDFCAQSLFDLSFTTDPLLWLNLIKDASFMRPVQGAHSNSAVSLDHETILLGQLSLNVSDQVQINEHPLDSVDSVERVVSLLIQFFSTNGSKITSIWPEELSAQVISEIIRQSLALVMASRSVSGTQRLKLLGIKLISSCIKGIAPARDLIDPDAPFLDPYFSQLVTIYSTACQDDDHIIMAESYSSLMKILCVPTLEGSWSNQPRIKGLIGKALSLLQYDGIRVFQSEHVELYVKCLVCSSFWSLMSSIEYRMEDEGLFNASIVWCLKKLTDYFIDGDIDPIVLDQVPCLVEAAISKKLQLEEYVQMALPTLICAGKVSKASISALIMCLQWKQQPHNAQLLGCMLDEALSYNSTNVYIGLFDSFHDIANLLSESDAEKLASVMLTDVLALGSACTVELMRSISRSTSKSFLGKLWSLYIQVLHQYLTSTVNVDSVALVLIDLFNGGGSALSDNQQHDLCAILFGYLH